MRKPGTLGKITLWKNTLGKITLWKNTCVTDLPMDGLAGVGSKDAYASKGALWGPERVLGSSRVALGNFGTDSGPSDV